MNAIRVTGTITVQAYATTGTDGSAWLTVVLAQPDAAAARCHARQCFGTGHAAQFAASHAARGLSRGTVVTVHANSFDLRLHPQPHLLLWGVDLIYQHPSARQQARHERQAEPQHQEQPA